MEALFIGVVAFNYEYLPAAFFLTDPLVSGRQLLLFQHQYPMVLNAFQSASIDLYSFEQV
jgi:hypothetical protein